MNVKSKALRDPSDKELLERLEKMQKKHDRQFKVVFAFLKKFPHRRGIKLEP